MLTQVFTQLLRRTLPHALDIFLLHSDLIIPNGKPYVLIPTRKGEHIMFRICFKSPLKDMHYKYYGTNVHVYLNKHLELEANTLP